MSEKKNEPIMMKHLSCIPYDPEVFSFINWGEYCPHTYTNWREETLSWKTSCYLSTFLSCFPAMTISGPDAIKLVSDVSVNSYKNFPINSCKHMIICSPKGNVIDHGLVLRTGEQEITTYITPFYLLYYAEKNHYDIQIDVQEGENRSWIFQLAGPRSLEIVENVLQEDVHDLKFMRCSYHTVAGHKVRLLRMGMGGSLSYEIQGNTDDAGIEVYREIMRVGAAYDIKRLGVNQYMCNHTENGFPQGGLHFPGAFLDDPDYVAYRRSLDFYMHEEESFPHGSQSEDIRDYYRNPYELGWGHMVKFDHDFVGREALEKIRDSAHRQVVTLEWDKDDIMKVFKSYFEEGEEPYEDMAFPQDFGIMGAAENHYYQHKVLKNGKIVGVSMWRTYTLYYRKTISMCCIDADQAQIGNEVTLIWGGNGKRELEIRAKVARYPYLDLVPNKDFDLNTIPRFSKA